MATEIQGEIYDQLEISKASSNTLNLQYEKNIRLANVLELNPFFHQ